MKFPRVSRGYKLSIFRGWASNKNEWNRSKQGHIKIQIAAYSGKKFNDIVMLHQQATAAGWMDWWPPLWEDCVPFRQLQGSTRVIWPWPQHYACDLIIPVLMGEIHCPFLCLYHKAVSLFVTCAPGPEHICISVLNQCDCLACEWREGWSRRALQFPPALTLRGLAEPARSPQLADHSQFLSPEQNPKGV